MKRMIALLLATIVAALVSAGAATAQAVTITTNEQVSYVFPVFVPCANEGGGEVVKVSGTQHVVTHVTVDDQGGYHFIQHFQSEGASGVGLASGNSYRFIQVQRNNGNSGTTTTGSTYTLTNSFQLIGQGSASNLFVHVTFHVAVTANADFGDFATVVDKLSVECR